MIAGVRVVRRTRLHTGALVVALLDLVVQSVLVLLGLALLLSPGTLVDGLGFESGQDWSDLAFALPLAIAYTGLRRSRTWRGACVHRSGDRREPGRGSDGGATLKNFFIGSLLLA